MEAQGAKPSAGLGSAGSSTLSLELSVGLFSLCSAHKVCLSIRCAQPLPNLRGSITFAKEGMVLEYESLTPTDATLAATLRRNVTT